MGRNAPTGPRRVRRDRHDRGARGPLLPHNVPAHSTAREEFLTTAKSAVTSLDERLGQHLKGFEFTIEEVPTKSELASAQGRVPLGRATRGLVNHVVLYRKPIEFRSPDKNKRERIIKDVLAEQIAGLLGVTPREIDPEYVGPDE